MKHAKIAPGVTLPVNADIRGRAVIDSEDDFKVYGPGRSSGKFTTAHRDADIGIRVNRGCFSGTVDQFERMIAVYAKDDPVMTEDANEYLNDMRGRFHG